MVAARKAEDTRLHRFVALKVLSDEVAKDPQSLGTSGQAGVLVHPCITR